MYSVNYITLFTLADATGGEVRVLTGAVGVGAGIEKSKRLFIPEVEAAGLAGADGVDVGYDSKS